MGAAGIYGEIGQGFLQGFQLAKEAHKNKALVAQKKQEMKQQKAEFALNAFGKALDLAKQFPNNVEKYNEGLATINTIVKQTTGQDFSFLSQDKDLAKQATAEMEDVFNGVTGANNKGIKSIDFQEIPTIMASIKSRYQKLFDQKNLSITGLGKQIEDVFTQERELEKTKATEERTAQRRFDTAKETEQLKTEAQLERRELGLTAEPPTPNDTAIAMDLAGITDFATATPEQYEIFATKREELAAQKKASTTINLGDTPEGAGKKKWAEVNASEYRKQYTSMQEESKLAHNMIFQADQMLKFVDEVPQGPIASASMGFKRAMLEMGVPVDDGNLTGQEVIEAAGNKMALFLRNPDSGGGLTGNTSDKDLSFLTNSTYGLHKTPQGNRVLGMAVKAMEGRKIELNDQAAEYIKENGMLDVGFDQQWSKYMKENPMFENLEGQINDHWDARGATIEAELKEKYGANADMKIIQKEVVGILAKERKGL